ncbi:hypothetical protein F5I97DRAFT_1812500, partial [Phlebopus sp. FC_14]
VKHSEGNIMVWGYIIAQRLGRIYQIEGNIDVELYTQILDEEFLGTLYNLGINKKDVYFQQDNDSKYTSKQTSSCYGV